MAKQTVGIGSSANDGTGDTLRAGADKINDNFNEVYAAIGNGTTLTDLIDSNGLLDVSSGANKIVFYYAALSDLPSASTYHGAIAHVHAAGGMYFAHGGAWLRLNDETTGPVTKYTVSAATGSAYQFTGPGATTGDNPNFTFYKGHTYLIDNSAHVSGHPLQIRTSSGGSAFTTGVTDNYNSTTGLTQFIVPHEPSDISLVYQCTVHSSMVGTITIV
tara:strand:- start:787 stop:1437 length:651 start_codon:yes stop_codon:yes gene_type:complete